MSARNVSISRRDSVVGQTLALTSLENEAPWYKVRHLVYLNTILLSLMMFSGTVGYDGSMMNGLQSLYQWQEFMDHPMGAWLGFINAIQAVGGIITFPIQAFVSDRFGRKYCLYFGLLFVILGSVVQAAAKDPAMFIVARFFIGSATAWFTAAAVLITEIAYPSHRAKVTALYNCQYYVGAVISSWVTFAVRNYSNSWAWRLPSLLQLAIPTMAAFGTFASPESPRWLVSKGRIQEAKAVLTKYHAGGDSNAALVLFEMADIEKAIALERESKNSASYMDMFRTKGNRHRLFITVTLGIFDQWVGNGVVSYYLALILETIGITSVTQQTLLNGFLNLWNLLMAIGAALLVDRVGRRKLFLASIAIMLVAYIVITALSATFAKNGVEAVGTAVIPFLFIFFAGYDIAFTPLLFSYPAEIWSFALRARGLAVVLSSTYIALLFNVFVNPIALASIAWKYYLVFVIMLVIAFVTIWFTYPETRGHSLEEMAVVFDGDNATIASSHEVLSTVEYAETGKRNKIFSSHVEFNDYAEKN